MRQKIAFTSSVCASINDESGAIDWDHLRVAIFFVKWRVGVDIVARQDFEQVAHVSGSNCLNRRIRIANDESFQCVNAAHARFDSPFEIGEKCCIARFVGGDRF